MGLAAAVCLLLVNVAEAPWIDGMVMPVVWKKRCGAGRCSIPRSATVPTSSTHRRSRL